MLTDKDAKYLFILMGIFWGFAFFCNFLYESPLWFTHAFIANFAALFGAIIQAAK